jgi:CRISPR-associated protein Csm4
MTALFVYRLRPGAPMHLGTGRAGDLADLDELPRSDTVSAALLSVWSHVDRDSDIGSLAAAPPFVVSSALPVLQDCDGRWQLLLPLPVGIIDRLALSPSQQKGLRRARFVEQSVLTELLAARLRIPVRTCSHCLLSEGLAERYTDGLWWADTRQRLAVNRLGDGPIPELLYEFGATSFAPGVCLGVVASCRSARMQATFEAALQLLGDEGLGADRSAGYGRFAVESQERVDPALGTGMLLSLSLFHPTADEVREGVLEAPAAYDLVIRGGWVTAPGARTLRKQNVRMLSEGSVIRDLGRQIYGDSPKVLDPMPELGLRHAVYRPGVAVTLPIEWRTQAQS